MMIIVSDDHMKQAKRVHSFRDGEFASYVKGYDGLYVITTTGVVISLERKCQTYKGERRVRTRVKLPSKANETGMLTVSLSADGKKKTYSVARIMLEAFVRDGTYGEIASIKDGCQDRLDISNIEWGSFSDIAKKNNSGYYFCDKP